MNFFAPSVVVAITLSALTPLLSLADNKTPWTVQSYCPPGDPLCLDTALFGPLPPSPRSTQTAPPRASSSTPPKTAAPPAPKAAVTVRTQTYQETINPRGGQVVNFEADALKGKGPGLDSIAAPPSVKTQIPCIDAYLGVFNDARKSITEVQRAYAQMQMCRDSCVTPNDAAFLSSCIDWTRFDKLRSTESSENDYLGYANTPKLAPMLECSDAQVREGLARGSYSGRHTDYRTGSCTQPETGTLRAVIDDGHRFAIAVAKSHECPQAYDDYRSLKRYAEYLLTLGGRPSQLPIPAPGSSERYMACGYSEKHQRTFSRGFYCQNADTCFDQMRPEYDAHCTRFVRAASGLFRAAQKDCVGQLSYHDAPEAKASRGDLVLIPVVPGVWIQGYVGGNGYTGLNYVGLVFKK